MFNRYLYNEAIYNNTLSIGNIIYSLVDNVNADLHVYFKYNCNINVGIESPNANTSANGTGLVIISKIDNLNGSINIKYKYRFDINSEIDTYIASLDAAPFSDKLDLSINEILYTISGANTIFGTPSMDTRSLGGYASWNRVESCLPLRLAPIENMELHFISGNHENEIIELNLEIDDNNSEYTIQYKDQDSTSYGEKVVIDFDKEIQLFTEDYTKHIMIKLNEAPLIEKKENIQLKNIYNNELILNEFDINDPKDIYSSFFVINSSHDVISDIKIYRTPNDKIDTLIGIEDIENSHIQTIPDIYTAPIGITFNDYDSSSAPVIYPELTTAHLFGVWIKSSLTSNEVSPYEKIELNIEYEKNGEHRHDKISSLTRIFDETLSNKFKAYYNFNDTIDSTSVNTEIIDSTSEFPFEISDTSSLIDGDFIYYDLVRLNKYGIESFKNTNKYIIYASDISGVISATVPNAPDNGSLLFDATGNMMVVSQYFPENEEDIRNRAYYFDFNFYKENDSSGNLLINSLIPMDVTSGNSSNLENMRYVINNTGINLLDGTPIIFKIFTKNDLYYSAEPFEISGEYFKRDSILSPGNVNVFYGKNFGVNRDILDNKNETININSDIDYIIQDNKILINYLDETIIKIVYRGETNLKNIMYLIRDYEIIEDDTLFTTATTTDINDKFEVEDNILYILVNLKRCLAIDFTNKIMYVKTIEHESDINLNDKFKNDCIFKRYDETILNIFSNKTQKFMPIIHIDDEGNVKNKFIFNNSKVNLDNIL